MSFCIIPQAFADTGSVISELRKAFRDSCHAELIAIEVSSDQVSVSESVGDISLQQPIGDTAG